MSDSVDWENRFETLTVITLLFPIFSFLITERLNEYTGGDLKTFDMKES